MNKADVIGKVGEEAYHEACEAARQDAARPDYGRSLGQGQFDSNLPHEIADLIWDGDLAWREKLKLFFEIYDEMPCYGHLMYVNHHYSDFTPADREYWWQMVRSRLSEPALAQPLAYSLWCDFFENTALVAEAWTAVSNETAPDAVLILALHASGPVPYPLKRRLYDRLLPDPRWHEAVYESLLRSAFDVYGQIEPRDACELLSSLALAPDTEHLATLREKLRCSPHDAAQS